MILRPVSPESPIGPPTTNRPVGLIQNLVLGVTSSLGSAQFMTWVRIASSSVFFFTSALCWVETTTASIATGRSSSYRTLTWVLPSGRRKSIPSICFFRTSARRRASLWASWIGLGISSLDSSQAYPNIIPWSPAPCSSTLPRSTPRAMSGDCCSMAVKTAQVL